MEEVLGDNSSTVVAGGRAIASLVVMLVAESTLDGTSLAAWDPKDAGSGVGVGAAGAPGWPRSVSVANARKCGG